MQTYIEVAKEHGFTGCDAKLESIGMAEERASCSWGWYESSKANGGEGWTESTGHDQESYEEQEAGHVADVLMVFSCSDVAPNEKGYVSAYMGGAESDTCFCHECA